MKGFYDFSVGISAALLRLVSRCSPKWRKLVEGRKEVFSSLDAFVGNNKRNIVWFHVASLGEYEQAKPVIHEFKRLFPDWAVAVTFFSPSGYEHVVGKTQPQVDFIAYLPFDTAGNAARFVDLLHPKAAFFVKYDLWANFVFAIKKKNIPLYLFSASFRRDQIYFKSYGGFFRKVIDSFDHIFTQNQQTVDLLDGIGYGRTTLTGDTRYDNVRTISQNPKTFADIATFVADSPVLVIGSAWEEDMDLIIPFINSGAGYRFIVAPHDINARLMADWQERITRPSLKYSELAKGNAQEIDVLFIDNIGMLSSLYRYASLAYVGGALGKGLHNILEPLAYGIPVVFGQLKNKKKFPEAGISQAYGCGFAVKDADGFDRIILHLEEDAVYQRACEAAEKLVNDNLGSAKAIVAHVQKEIREK